MTRLKNNIKAFTMVELLIVIAIIGVLSVIAIPQMSQYRQRAFNSAAETDVRNFRTYMEVVYDEYFAYPNL